MQPLLRCTVTSDVAQLPVLEEDWRAVWRSDHRATVFQGFDWGLHWARHYASVIDELLVLTCYDGDRAVGLAALYVRKRGNPFSPALLMFFGTGEPERDEAFAEYMAPLCVPGYEARCAEAMVSVIRRYRVIAGFEFARGPEDRLTHLAERLSRQWQRPLEVRSRGECFNLPADTEAALERLSRRQRGTLRRKLGKLRAMRGFEVRVADDRESLDDLFAALMTLHQRRWRGKGKPGVFSSERFRDFHLAVTAQLLDRGQLLLFGLFAEGRALAVNYCMVSKDACHYYQGGIDDDHAPELSPGLLSHLLGAGIAGERGLQRYDLMLGGKGSYKARLGFEAEQLVTLACRRSPLARLRAAW